MARLLDELVAGGDASGLGDRDYHALRAHAGVRQRSGPPARYDIARDIAAAGAVLANGAGTGQRVTVALNELTAMPCPPFQISKPNSMSIRNQARWS
jgi:hypothetical protein